MEHGRAGSSGSQLAEATTPIIQHTGQAKWSPHLGLSTIEAFQNDDTKWLNARTVGYGIFSACENSDLVGISYETYDYVAGPNPALHPWMGPKPNQRWTVYLTNTSGKDRSGTHWVLVVYDTHLDLWYYLDPICKHSKQKISCPSRFAYQYLPVCDKTWEKDPIVNLFQADDTFPRQKLQKDWSVMSV